MIFATLHRLRFFSLVPVAFSLAAVLLSAAEPSPVGLWKTFDDKTHEQRGTVRIYEQNGLYFGKIESSVRPEELNLRCQKCTGNRKDAPIRGLVIMRNMRKDGSQFDSGDILDPDTGSVYKCKFKLTSNGNKLVMRGFLGISLLGRTQTWIRTGK